MHMELTDYARRRFSIVLGGVILPSVTAVCVSSRSRYDQTMPAFRHRRGWCCALPLTVEGLDGLVVDPSTRSDSSPRQLRLGNPGPWVSPARFGRNSFGATSVTARS